MTRLHEFPYKPNGKLVPGDDTLSDENVEKGVFGSLMLDGSAALGQCDRLLEKMFFSRLHRKIYRGLTSMIADDGVGAPTVTLLADWLVRHNEPQFGGLGYLASLTEGIPHRMDLTHYVGILVELYQRRQAWEAGQKLIAGSQDRGQPIKETLARLQVDSSRISEVGRGGSSSARPRFTKEDAVGLNVKRGTEIIPREQGWIVQDFLPDDSLVVVAGEQGTGKTTGCVSWAADLTMGRIPVIGGECEARNVLVLSNEDSEARLHKMFVQTGGNLSRLYVENEEADYLWGLADIPALEARIAEINPALVIIDCLSTYKPHDVNLNSHGDVAPMLVALRKVATAHHCAIAVIHHTNKVQTTSALLKIAGTMGITSVPRHVIFMAVHPEDKGLIVALVVKSNLAPKGKANYQFRLDPCRWEGRTGLLEDDVLQAGDDRSNKADAEAFLRDTLRDAREDCVKLKKLAEDGFGINSWTLHRAATKMGIVREFSGFGRERKAYWSLPRDVVSHEGEVSIDDIIDDKYIKPVIDGRDQ